MKKAIFMISVIILIVLFLLSLNACNLQKGTTEIKDSGQSISENSKESTQTPDSNEENIQDSATNENEDEFSELYNSPEGGSPENVGKIIFCSESKKTEENGDYYLYTINPDGSNMTKMPFFGDWMWHPVWSPEYSRIAYSANLGGDNKIFIMTADGSINKQLTFGEGRDKFSNLVSGWKIDCIYIIY